MADDKQIQVQQRTAFDDFWAEITLRKNAIEKVLPKHMTVDRFVTQVHFALSRNKTLLECTRSSVISAVLSLAELGLDPSGTLGSGYLVPFNVKGTKECVPIPGYRGLIDLAVRSGEVKGITANPVFWGDEFDVDLGDRPRLHHKPKIPQSKEEQVGLAAARVWDNTRACYAVATLQGGLKQFMVLYFEDLELVRRRAPGGRSENTPWAAEPKGSRIEMYVKSPIRKLCKQLPLSPSKASALQRALQMEEEMEERTKDDEPEETEKAARSGTQSLKDAFRRQDAKKAPEPELAEYMSTDEWKGPTPPDDVKLPTLDDQKK